VGLLFGGRIIYENKWPNATCSSFHAHTSSPVNWACRCFAAILAFM
jgi:hypothetical protein